MGIEEKREETVSRNCEDKCRSPKIPNRTSEEPRSERKKRKTKDTILKVGITAFLAFVMCWPTHLEVRKGESEPRHCEPGSVYVVRRRSAGHHHPSKTCAVPVPTGISKKSPPKMECSSPPAPASPIATHNEQHIHQHTQKEQTQEVEIEEKVEVKKEVGEKTKGLELKLDISKTEMQSPENEHKIKRIRELEVELKILRQTRDKDDELYTIPEGCEVPLITRRSPYRISVPGRYFGEIVYVGNDEVDYVYRSPKVTFED